MIKAWFNSDPSHTKPLWLGVKEGCVFSQFCSLMLHDALYRTSSWHCAPLTKSSRFTPARGEEGTCRTLGVTTSNHRSQRGWQDVCAPAEQRDGDCSAYFLAFRVVESSWTVGGNSTEFCNKRAMDGEEAAGSPRRQKQWRYGGSKMEMRHGSGSQCSTHSGSVLYHPYLNPGARVVEIHGVRQLRRATTRRGKGLSSHVGAKLHRRLLHIEGLWPK